MNKIHSAHAACLTAWAVNCPFMRFKQDKSGPETAQSTAKPSLDRIFKTPSSVNTQCLMFEEIKMCFPMEDNLWCCLGQGGPIAEFCVQRPRGSAEAGGEGQLQESKFQSRSPWIRWDPSEGWKIITLMGSVPVSDVQAPFDLRLHWHKSGKHDGSFSWELNLIKKEKRITNFEW